MYAYFFKLLTFWKLLLPFFGTVSEEGNGGCQNVNKLVNEGGNLMNLRNIVVTVQFRILVAS